MEVGEGLTKQNCKGQSGEGAIFVAALVATILNKVQDNRVTLLHSRQTRCMDRVEYLPLSFLRVE